MSEISNKNIPVESQLLKASGLKPKANPEAVAGKPDFKNAAERVAKAAIDGTHINITSGNIEAPGRRIDIAYISPDKLAVNIASESENKFHLGKTNFENEFQAYLAFERSTMA